MRDKEEKKSIEQNIRNALITIVCCLVVAGIIGGVNLYAKIERVEERERNHYNSMVKKIDALIKKMDSIIIYHYTNDRKQLTRVLPD